MTEMSQNALMAYLDELQRYMLKVWREGRNDGLVRAAKYAWHSCSVINHIDNAQMLPRAFVTMTKTLDLFGDLIYTRVTKRATEILKVDELPKDYLSMDIPGEPIEMCNNWFNRLSRTRELAPRLLLKIALWRSQRLLHDDFKAFFDASLMSLAAQIRGIADPAMAAHLMWYLCHRAAALDKEFYGVLGVGYAERLLSDHYIVAAALQSAPSKPGLSPAGYRSLLTPGLAWVVDVLVRKGNIPFKERWALCQEKRGVDVVQAALLKGYVQVAPDDVLDELPNILLQLASIDEEGRRADTTPGAAEGYGAAGWEVEGDGMWGILEALGQACEMSVLPAEARAMRCKGLKKSQKSKVTKLPAYPETEKGRRDIAKKAWAAMTREAAAERARREAYEQSIKKEDEKEADEEGGALAVRPEDGKFLKAMKPWVGYTLHGLGDNDLGYLLNGLANQVRAPLGKDASEAVEAIINEILAARGYDLDATILPALFDLLGDAERGTVGRAIVAAVLGLVHTTDTATMQCLSGGSMTFTERTTDHYHVDPVPKDDDDDDDDEDEALPPGLFNGIKAGNAALGAVLDVCRSMHDQIGPLGDEREMLATSRLLSMLIQRVSHETPEAQLDFLLDSRRSFYRLQQVLTHIIINAVDMTRPDTSSKKKKKVNVRTEHQDRAFRKACLTFCHVSIPGLLDPVLRILAFAVAMLAGKQAKLEHHEKMLFEACKDAELALPAQELKAVRGYFDEAVVLLQLPQLSEEDDPDLAGAEGDEPTFADRFHISLKAAGANPKKGHKRLAHYEQVLTDLLAVSANPEITDVAARTPLCDAAASDRSQSYLEAWIEEGASTSAMNAHGETPMKVATRLGSTGNVAVLKKAGGK
eukprot:TRINITY_DN3222_c2_g1_i2.p1 TRINITY_DN3222_c2_g1~~TRINITY_DN3222_c2_g1_i2.p1  ORF type:complete len:871 (+),score=315.28 TRINITY_DN3222_c2_g1_i2:280-2892(+)